MYQALGYALVIKQRSSSVIATPSQRLWTSKKEKHNKYKEISVMREKVTGSKRLLLLSLQIIAQFKS